VRQNFKDIALFAGLRLTRVGFCGALLWVCGAPVRVCGAVISICGAPVSI